MSDGEPGAEPPQRVVVRRLDGFPALLRHLEDGSTVLEGVDGSELPELSSGERLLITRPIVDDATYVQPARVLEVLPDQRAIPVKAGGETQREQQRQFVRVRTDPHEVVVVGGLEGDGDGGGGELRDISAGGLRAVGTSPPVGSRLRLVFGLPTEAGPDHRLELDGEVMWSGRAGEKPAVGIRFLDLDTATEQLLASWVLRQQARRGRGR